MQPSFVLSQLPGALLPWYHQYKRDLPWRADQEPYHIWISEIMLQQTRVEAVKGYYARFLHALPTIDALAQCEDDVLHKLWEGLGYYSRARCLKKAALVIENEYAGKLPEEAKTLEKLPGIGPYTAGAIASICFGKPAPAIDGNVLRVITRLLGDFSDIMQGTTKKKFTELLSAVYPIGKEAGILTQSIMELGEAVCIPNGEAKCALCPLASICTAKREGLIDSLPVKTPKKARRIEKKTVFLLSCRGRYALRKRPENGLLAGLWELPSTEGHLSEEEASEMLTMHSLTPVSLRTLGEAKHIFTHIEWHMQGYEVECAEETSDFLWKSAEEIKAHFAIPTAFRGYTKYIE